MYQVELSKIITEIMTDEISASTMYIEASGYIRDITLSKEILTHADEEFSHFKTLMNFAIVHDLKTNYDFNRTVIKKVPKNEKQIIKLIQGLEMEAIEKYKKASLLARDNNDLEAETMFISLMNAEMEHFDDVAQVTGQTRKVENFQNFKHYIKTR